MLFCSFRAAFLYSLLLISHMDADAGWERLGGMLSFMKLGGMELREYQLNIIDSVKLHGNTLVVLPTGLGKTLIGVAAVADSLSHGRKALFLSPTKPLAEQHYSTLEKTLNIESGRIALLLGSVPKGRRAELEAGADVLIATPQTIANDLKRGSVALGGFGVAVFDECHRAVGKYAYTYIANECLERNVKIIGLTASPGSKKEKINAILETLGIRHIEVRTSYDSDVSKYVMPRYMHIMSVERTVRIEEIARRLRPEIERSLTTLNKMGFLHFKNFESIPKGRLLEAGSQINRIQNRSYRFGALFSYIKLLNLIHAYDLLLVEGIYPFFKYLESLEQREKKSRSVESLLKNSNIAEARRLSAEAVRNGEEHAKVFAVLDIVRKHIGKSIIIFAQYRSTIKILVEFLRNNGFNAVAFVGKREGVTQEAQKKAMEEFRQHNFDILVASSIGEEGLDVPSVDVVIFYEAIPNEIRNIQRKGRTGRVRAGEVYILVAKGSKDEVYLYVSRQREERMSSILHALSRSLEKKGPGVAAGQSRLS